MDSILSNQLFFALQEDPEPEDEAPEKVSTWVVEGDMIRPSVSLGLLPKIHSGVYKVEVSREIGYYCKKINVDSDELFLFENSIVPDIISEVSRFWDKAEEYKANKVIHKRGMLFFGYPGCGKTSIISLLCNELIQRKGVIFSISGPENLQYYVTFMKNYFRQIEPQTPIITIIEDIDTYSDSPIILDFLDGKSQIEHHLVIATTNNTKNIPSSFTRPSRIDLKVEVPYPDEETRKEYLKQKKFDPSKLDEVASLTDSFSFADLKELFIAVTLLDYTIEDAIKKILSKDIKKDYSSSRLKINTLGL